MTAAQTRMFPSQAVRLATVCALILFVVISILPR
jgi:hypothetical protein